MCEWLHDFLARNERLNCACKLVSYVMLYGRDGNGVVPSAARTSYLTPNLAATSSCLTSSAAGLLLCLSY